MFDKFTKDEFAKLNAEVVKSDYETSVESDIMNWVYEQMLLSLADGKEPIKFDSVNQMIELYWKDKLK